MALDNYRNCARGSHERCKPDNCLKRRELESKARACRLARDILDCLKEHGLDRSLLGDELPKLREQARWPMDKLHPWLAVDFQPDILTKMEAKYAAETIIGRLI